MLGAAQSSKGKERVKKPPASSRPLVYQTREGMGLGKAPPSPGAPRSEESKPFLSTQDSLSPVPATWAACVQENAFLSMVGEGRWQGALWNPGILLWHYNQG